MDFQGWEVGINLLTTPIGFKAQWCLPVSQRMRDGEGLFHMKEMVPQILLSSLPNWNAGA